MIAEGQIVLFRFPQTDQEAGKLRPALVLRRLPGIGASRGTAIDENKAKNI